MKKEGISRGIVLGLATGFLCSGIVFAAGEEQKNTSAGKSHSWEIGAELSSITYEEPGVMEESGAMIGLAGSYTYRNNWMFKIEGVFKYGQVDYEGALFDGTPLNVDNIDDYIVEARGLGGYDFSVFKATTLTPYIGFGYRYIFDDLGAASPYGYGRESNYSYSPIGIETMTDLQNGWFIGLIIEYDIFWSGVQTSYLSDFDYSLNDVENDQSDGYGFRGSVKFQNSRFVIEPYIRYWEIDDSDPSIATSFGRPVAVLYEPENDSTEIGVKFAVKF
jgi:hypothetical protein